MFTKSNIQQKKMYPILDIYTQISHAQTKYIQNTDDHGRERDRERECTSLFKIMMLIFSQRLKTLKNKIHINIKTPTPQKRNEKENKRRNNN